MKLATRVLWVFAGLSVPVLAVLGWLSVLRPREHAGIERSPPADASDDPAAADITTPASGRRP